MNLHEQVIDFEKKLKNLRSNEDYEGIVQLLNGLAQHRTLKPAELVLKGCALQLSSAGDPHANLADAEASFVAAVEADPEYAPALLELAWFYYAVEDNCEKAEPLFERVLGLSKTQAQEAVKGIAKCKEENAGTADAETYLREMHAIRLDLDDASGEEL